MVHDYRAELPSIFPTDGDVEVEEDHTYRVYQDSDGGTTAETEYLLDKAPITKILSVVGTVNGRQNYTFSQGNDYELSNDSNRIVWLNGTRPDDNTTFTVTYISNSILSRFNDSAEDELKTVDEALTDVIESKFVDKADVKELDNLGELFGVLGQRRGRDDTQYRIYLKSVVQSFVSRGTVNGIKLAVSAATDVPIEDITINEDFDEGTYEVEVVANTPVTSSVLDQVTEIADPSGINKSKTRFTIDPDEMLVADQVQNIKEGSDAQTFEEVQVDDTQAINTNKTLGGDEDVAVEDALTISTTSVAWDGNSWGSFDWQ